MNAVHLLAFAAEFVEIEVDGVDELDRHRIFYNRVRPIGLVGPAVEGEQCRFRDTGQHSGVNSMPGMIVHRTNPTETSSGFRELIQHD